MLLRTLAIQASGDRRILPPHRRTPRPSHWPRALALLLFAAFCSPALRPAHAAETQVEYQVKAAFLLNFTKYVEWPPDPAAPGAPLSICILGEDPFGPVLDQMVAGETLRGRKIEVQRVRRPPPSSCSVLFAGKTEKDVGAVLSMLGPGVLTVGEGDDFLRQGGMISFFLDSHRVRFDINQSVASKAGLVLSSKLLSVARSVAR